MGLTLLREEVRNRKLLGFWALPGGGDVLGEGVTSDKHLVQCNTPIVYDTLILSTLLDK